jgi:uncharacterized protein YuzE
MSTQMRHVASVEWVESVGGPEILITFAVALGHTAHSRSVDCVVDVDETGRLLGFELLSPRHALGATAASFVALPPTPPEIRVSYDENSDAVYLRLRDGPSYRQEVLQGDLAVDDSGRVALRLPLEGLISQP